MFYLIKNKFPTLVGKEVIVMYKKLSDIFGQFINAEVGKVGFRTSLSIGLVGGGLLLTQTMFPSAAKAGFECLSDDDCSGNEVCHFWCEKIEGICYGNWHSKCVST